MKAASRVQCYDNRDVYFFCLGATASSRRGQEKFAAVLGMECAAVLPFLFCIFDWRERARNLLHVHCTDGWKIGSQSKMVKTAPSANPWRRRCRHNHAQKSRIAAILHFHTSPIALAHALIVFQQY